MRQLALLLPLMAAAACCHDGSCSARRPPANEAPSTPAPEPDAPPLPSAAPALDAAPAQAEPNPPPFVPGPCVLEEPVELGATSARRPDVVVSLDPTGGLLAYSVDGSHVAIHSLDAQTTPANEAVTVEVPGAVRLWGLYRVGDRFLLVSHDLCTDTPPSQMLKCLFFQPLDGTGRPAGPPFHHQTGEWASGWSIVEGDALIVLREHTYMPPVLERYRLAPDGTITRAQLGDMSQGIERGEAEPADAAALAVDGERIAALGSVVEDNDDLSEDGRWSWFLHFGDGREVRLRRRLPEGARCHGLRFAGADRLELLYERSGRLFRAFVGLDGSIEAPPARIETGELGGWPAAPRLDHSADDGPLRLGLSRGGTEWLHLPVVAGPARAGAVGGGDGLYALVTVDDARSRPRAVRLRRARCVAAAR